MESDGTEFWQSVRYVGLKSLRGEAWSEEDVRTSESEHRSIGNISVIVVIHST